MIVSVNIDLDQDDALADDAATTASKLLTALGADPAKDTCRVTITRAPDAGLAGFDPNALPGEA